MEANEDRVAKIINMYSNQNLSVDRIRKELSIGMNIIYEILKNNDVVLRGSKDACHRAKIDKELAIDLYKNKKKTLKEIATIFNCGAETVRTNLKKWGVKSNTKPAKNIIKNIGEEVLRKLYVADGMSINDIAKKYECSANSANRALRAYGIPIRTSVESMVIKNHNSKPISKELMEIIEGELLGDGSIRKRTGKITQAHYRHEAKNLEHIEYLIGKFGKENIKCSNVRVRERQYKNKCITYAFNTESTAELAQIHKKWYIDGKKIVPNDIEITKKVLYSWYVGDGCLSKRSNGSVKEIIISSQSFEKCENELLSKKIKENFDIEVTIRSMTSSYSGLTQYYLVIPKRHTQKFISIMEDRPMQCYEYKFDA